MNTEAGPAPSVERPSIVLPNSRRWTIVGLLWAASLINYVDRATLSFAIPLMALELDLTSLERGKLLAAFFPLYALMQIPIGWCADRFNLRWLYAAAFALWSIAQGLTGFGYSLLALIS